MKLRKIFAGMSALAVASALSLSASAFNAGLFFQTSDYVYRDGYLTKGAETVDGEFPLQSIGIYGESGFDEADGTFEDAEITTDGHVTLKMNRCSGAVTKGVTKVDRKTKEETDTTGMEWGIDAEGVVFNMLGVTTDLTGFEITESEEEGGPVTVTYNGNEVKFENATLTIGSQSFDIGELRCKSDNTDNLTMMAINLYDKPETNLVGDYTRPGADDTITLEFDVTGFGAPSEDDGNSDDGNSDDGNSDDGNSDDGSSDSSSKDDSSDSSSKDDSSDSSSESGSDNSGSGSTGSGSTGSGTSNTSGGSTSGGSSSGGSSTGSGTGAATSTENNDTGASSMALAGLALAGAAIVVTKRK